MTTRRSILHLLLLLVLSYAPIAHGEEKSSIKVVMAGFPRSGSLSLSKALERLGYKTCHGMDLVNAATGKFRGVLEALAENRIDDALDSSEEAGCEAIFEFHSPHWREIREKRPNAKFLVVIRNYDSWEKSISSLLGVLSPMFRYPLRLLPPFSLILRFNIATAQHWLHIDNADDALDYLHNPETEQAKQIRKRAHELFVKDSQQFVQQEPDRALLFSLKDGYQPLCEFLGIDKATCPDEEFPHANSGVEVKKTALIFYTLQVLVFAAPLFVLWVLWKVLPWLYRMMSGNSKSSVEKKTK